MIRKIQTRNLGVVMLLALASTVVLSTVGCPKSEESASVPVVERVATAEFLVKNMTCTSCDKAIVSTLNALDGVSNVRADFKRGYAFAEYDPNSVNTDDLVVAINGLGFESRVRTAGDVDIPPAKHGVPEPEEGE